MVMRKFRKSLDHGDTANGSEEQLNNNSSAAPSPRVGKKLINGGQDQLGLPPGSPSVRRRRSRIPSEEDDQLINFLVTGSNDGTGGIGAPGSRERNASTGALGKRINSFKQSKSNGQNQYRTCLYLFSDSQSYGSLDRGLLRRSRGRKRTDVFTSEDRDRQMSSPPDNVPADPKAGKGNDGNARSGGKEKKKMKSRIESWLKDAEEDASKAEEYLDKKKEKKRTTKGNGQDVDSF